LALEKIRKWLVYTVSWCICKFFKYVAYTQGALSAHSTGKYLISSHIHQEMVYTRYFLIFSRPQPAGCVYVVSQQWKTAQTRIRPTVKEQECHLIVIARAILGLVIISAMPLAIYSLEAVKKCGVLVLGEQKTDIRQKTIF